MAIYIHDDTLATADGEDITGQLQTGELGAEQLSEYLNSNSWLRLSRIYYDVHLEADNASPIIQSEIGNKTKPDDVMTFNPAAVLEDDFRHDLRLIDKIFCLRLTSLELLSLSGFSFVAESAGGRA